ncbi:MAG: hypothetical protein JNK21_01895, partial [Rhodospirillaceae bacterium]|nr:hypothetical protein [Rhodospirillaceae bacterium]
TMQPFAAGDLLLGATDLNVPEDDHAGDGRIFQFDKNFNLKGILYTEGTTHLVKGLTFGPDGLLWAFDSAEHMIIWVDPKTGKQVNPGYSFPKRPWSSAIWDKAGNTFLYEHITGKMEQVPEKYRHMTKLVPGTDHVGFGNVLKFGKDGKLIKEFNTDTSTSFAGHLGVTSCLLHPSETRLIYTTETSKRIMQYDVIGDKQMPDLYVLPQEAREFVFCLGQCADGTIVVTRGAKWEHLDEAGKVLRTYPLEGPGWAIIKESLDRKHVFVNSFFTGLCLKFEKDSGKVVGSCQVPAQRSLAGFAEYAG